MFGQSVVRPALLVATFVVALLLLFASSLSSLLRIDSFVTCARLLIAQSFSSYGVFGQEGPRRARHCFDEAVVDRFGRLLSIHEVIKLRLVFFKRLFDSAYHFWSFPSASSSTHSWPQRTRLAHTSSFPVLGFFLCHYQRVVVPPYAPYQLQSNSCSYQDSAQAQPRQHICGCGKKSRSRFLGLAKVGSPSWKVLITAIPSSCMGSLSKEAADPSFSGTNSSVTAWFSSSFLGSPIRSLRSVMMQGVLLFDVSWSVFLSHPARPYSVSAQAALLHASCRFWRPIHHNRGDIFLPTLEPDGACSPLQRRRSIKCHHHAPRFPRSLVHKDGSCGHVREARLLVSPSHFDVSFSSLSTFIFSSLSLSLSSFIFPSLSFSVFFLCPSLSLSLPLSVSLCLCLRVSACGVCGVVCGVYRSMWLWLWLWSWSVCVCVVWCGALKNRRVSIQNAPVCKFKMYTLGRFEWTLGSFSARHTTPHHTTPHHTTPHTHHDHNHRHSHSHSDTHHRHHMYSHTQHHTVTETERERDENMKV